MRAQNVVNVVPIYVALAPNLLHHNNVGTTYAWISNFQSGTSKICTIIFYGNAPLYGIIIEGPFIITLAKPIFGMKPRP
jgi:hypothetical protein